MGRRPHTPEQMVSLLRQSKRSTQFSLKLSISFAERRALPGTLRGASLSHELPDLFFRSSPARTAHLRP